MSSDIKEIKIVILGDAGVGKSSIIQQYVTGEFNSKPEPTLGAAYRLKVLTLGETTYKLQIWDTAG